MVHQFTTVKGQALELTLSNRTVPFELLSGQSYQLEARDTYGNPVVTDRSDLPNTNIRLVDGKIVILIPGRVTVNLPSLCRLVLALYQGGIHMWDVMEGLLTAVPAVPQPTQISVASSSLLADIEQGMKSLVPARVTRPGVSIGGDYGRPCKRGEKTVRAGNDTSLLPPLKPGEERWSADSDGHVRLIRRG
jgi:hypothetical protein